jgi:acetoacetate decarboxylase
MPDLVGFGDYTETGQVIPVRFNGREGNYTHAMYLDAAAPIVGGREIWGFPRSWPSPTCASRAKCWSARSIAVRSAA